ncbi:hypothetical protein N4R57_03590 [Rhodobacteraceae bacterium D3-12]|nr:hypothetical protein N4R57_03590 [Rhodobacteraceae bacterium D3-12]
MFRPPPSPLLWSTRPVSMIAFFAALLLAPLIVGILGAPLYLISMLALLFGLPVYLLLGAPVMFWMLCRGERRKSAFAVAGVLLNSTFVIGLYIAYPDSNGLGIFYLLFGTAFAPIWAATFTALYKRFTRNSNIYA